MEVVEVVVVLKLAIYKLQFSLMTGKPEIKTALQLVIVLLQRAILRDVAALRVKRHMDAFRLTGLVDEITNIPFIVLAHVMHAERLVPAFDFIQAQAALPQGSFRPIFILD